MLRAGDGAAPPLGARSVLVTGGAGFVGSHLVEALLGQGSRVTVLDDLSTGRLENLEASARAPRLRVVEGSVTDTRLVGVLARDSDTVFHLAAVVGVERVLANPSLTLETNLEGTRVVLGAAAERGASIVLTSTSEVYGRSPRLPYREDDGGQIGPSDRARWSYAVSKLSAEALLLAAHRDEKVCARVARLFNTVGPRQSHRYGMVVPRFVRQALGGEPLTVYGDGTQTRCFLDVDDAVRALLELAREPAAAGLVVNVGSTDERRILDVAHLVLRLTARPGSGPGTGEIRFVPYEDACGGDLEDMRRRVPDVSRLTALTRWAPRHALEATVERILRGLGPLPPEIHGAQEAGASLRTSS